MKAPAAGRAWAYLGLGVSLAANVQAAYIDNDDPGWVTLMMAGLPPAAVFVAIEVLARNRWPEGTPWRRTKRFGTYGLAVSGAVVSYVHLVHLMVHDRGIDLQALTLSTASALLVAVLTPLIPDGLLGLCTGALLIDRHQTPGSDLALREVRERVVTVPVVVEREVVREIPVPGPERIVYVPRPAVPNPVPRQQPARLPEHPLYAAFRAAHESGVGWSNERMLKELQTLNPATTEPAARAMANRWRKTLK